MSDCSQTPDQCGSNFYERNELQLDPRRLVFLGGLHRSGTTLMGRILADHPHISGFSGTGAIENEGQHLQTVYLPARTHGGPGRFARAAGAHLTEVPQALRQRAAVQLLQDWSPYWDLERKYLVEKSPPNMIMGRYLQSVFPGSALIVILRHPVIVALATKKWTRRTTLVSLVEHWFVAHGVLVEDAQLMSRLLVLRYEDLMADPQDSLARIQRFLGLADQFSKERLLPTRSDVYLEAWASMSTGGYIARRRRAEIERRFSGSAHEYGYRVGDPATVDSWSSTAAFQKLGQGDMI